MNGKYLTIEQKNSRVYFISRIFFIGFYVGFILGKFIKELLQEKEGEMRYFCQEINL